MTGNTIVVFDVQRTDIGNVYNRFTGRFTAPSSGVYCFGVSFLARPSKGCHLELVKNGIRIGQGYASTPNSETGHIQAVVYLKKGKKYGFNIFLHTEHKRLKASDGLLFLVLRFNILKNKNMSTNCIHSSSPFMVSFVLAPAYIWRIYLSVDTIFLSLWFLSGFP